MECVPGVVCTLTNVAIITLIFKTMDYSLLNLDFGQKGERASQEEQNGENFSFVAPSTVE